MVQILTAELISYLISTAGQVLFEACVGNRYYLLTYSIFPLSTLEPSVIDEDFRGKRALWVIDSESMRVQSRAVLCRSIVIWRRAGSAADCVVVGNRFFRWRKIINTILEYAKLSNSVSRWG